MVATGNGIYTTTAAAAVTLAYIFNNTSDDMPL
jgi:hypothetical protein